MGIAKGFSIIRRDSWGSSNRYWIPQWIPSVPKKSHPRFSYKHTSSTMGLPPPRGSIVTIAKSTTTSKRSIVVAMKSIATSRMSSSPKCSTAASRGCATPRWFDGVETFHLLEHMDQGRQFHGTKKLGFPQGFRQIFKKFSISM